MSGSNKPIGVTLGDPAGIGPEVVACALQTFLGQHQGPAPWVFGPANVLARLRDAFKDKLCYMAQPDFAGPMGVASAAAGAASLDALNAAIVAADAGNLGALCTAPINKGALALAGSADRGHTEILARRLGTGPVAMAFYAPQLKLVLCTVHIPLRDVFSALNKERIVEVAQLFSDSLRRHFKIAQPRLALAGLNPHAGEGGLLGTEEMTLLAPAALAAKAEGVNLSPPLPADTVFRQALDGAFDGVVALYHDQGLIPIKLQSFGEAVNVTLGLKLPRTSPDHGTAYDIVGKGTARSDGMLAALTMATKLSQP